MTTQNTSVQNDNGQDNSVNQNVVELFPKEVMQKIQDEKAKRELVDYLRWSLKHELDPHALYDDPVAVFRNTPAAVPAKNSSSVA